MPHWLAQLKQMPQTSWYWSYQWSVHISAQPLINAHLDESSHSNYDTDKTEDVRCNTNEIGGRAQMTLLITSKTSMITHSAAGVWPEACIPEGGRGRTHPHPVPQGDPFSKKFRPTIHRTAWSTPKGTQWCPTIPHHNHTTHFLRAWSKSTSTHLNLFSVPAIPPGSLTGLCQANGGAWQKVKGHAERRRARLHSRHINRVHKQFTAPESQT